MKKEQEESVDQKENAPKKKRRFILVRIIGVFLLLLGILLVLTVKNTSFQTYLAQKASVYLSEKTGSKISIEKLSFHWYKELAVEGVLILDHHQDTLLYAKELSLEVEDLDFENQSYRIVDVQVIDANVELVKYQGEEELNLTQFVQKLNLNDSENKDSTAISLFLEELNVKGVSFRFWDENKTIIPYGVDYQHLLLKNVNGDIQEILFKNDSLSADINELLLSDRSGFELKSLSGGLKLNSQEFSLNQMNLQSSETDLHGDLSFLFKEFSDLNDFVKKVKLKSNFTTSTLSGKDLSYFVPVLEGVKEKVQIQGKIKGKISRLKLRDFIFSYGEGTVFKGKLNIDGLPDVENAFVYIDVKEFETIEKDINQIPLPPFTEEHRVITPSWFKNLGKISFDGKYTGFFNDFVAYGTFVTSCGKVETDVNFNKNESGGLTIGGKLNTNRFNLRRLLNEKELGQLAFNGALDARVQGKKFLLEMQGKSSRFDFHNYSYTGITVDGKMTPREFKGSLAIQDSNLIMDFKGDINFSRKLQEYKFTAHVNRAKLHNLNLINRDSTTNLAFDVDIDLRGNKIQEIYGDVNVFDFNWEEKGVQHQFNTTKIRSIKRPNKEMISVASDWFTGRIEGKYDLTELYPSLVNILARDLPSLIDWKYSKAASKGKNDFRLMFKVKEYGLIHDLFTPNLDFENATFSGSFNDKEQLFRLNFKTDELVLNDIKSKKLKLFAHNQGEKVTAVLNSEVLSLTDSLGLKGLRLTTASANNLTNYELQWDNGGEWKNSGDVKGKLGVEKLDSVWTHIDQFDITIEDKLWGMDSLNRLVFTPSSVLFDHFTISNQDQLLAVEGIFSTEKKNQLNIKTERFQLNNLASLLRGSNTNIEGVMTGGFQLEGQLNQPILNSNMVIDDFKLNAQGFGKVKLLADYFSEEGRVALDFQIENQSKFIEGNTFLVRGDYYPLRDGELDLFCRLTNLRIQFLEEYFNGVFSDFKRGKTSGVLRVKGTTAAPEIYGNLRLDQMNLMVDYLNVEYAVNAQYLYFNNNRINFKDFTLRHNTYTKSEAVINGYVEHSGFKEINYSMDAVRLKDLFCLNTTLDDNSSYYGTAFVDGLLTVKGDGKNNAISGTISTVSYEDKLNKGRTALSLPLGEVGELEVSDFIHFVDLKGVNSLVQPVDSNLDVSGLSMDLSFLIHDETEAKIIFDPKVGDEIAVNGEGNINLKITPEGQFLMSGKYTISKGKYFFTLKNFIGKKLIVEDGGTISWDGDPLNAEVDIQTHYQARAKLSDLLTPAEETDVLLAQYGSRSIVYSSLALKGELMKPDITMSVNLPNGTVQEKEFLTAHIVGEDEVNRQAFALLLTNQFMPIHSTGLAGSVNVGTGIDNGIQFLEGQLNNAVGGLFNNVDLGVDYNSGGQDSLSQDELRLLFGFQYKKFSIKTDYALNNDAGEIQIEYKLTDQLKAKAFRRRTEQAILDNGSNVTQGAGLIFQRSFNDIAELFRRKKKKEK